MSEAIWTVGRLIEKLQKLPADLPIIGIYDYAFIEKAQKNHKKVKTVTVHDVVAIKTAGSRNQDGVNQDGVVIKTTGVLEF